MIKQIYSSFCYLGTILFLATACSSPETALPKKTPKVEEPVSMTIANTDSMNKTNKEAQIEMDSSISKKDLIGDFEPAKHADFTLIEKQYASREGMYLRKDAYASFIKMAAAAKKDNIDFVIKSATRNFAAQKVIWEGKWNGTRLLEGGTNAAKKFPKPNERALKILEYSSMPGTSRHHWGTDIDLNAFVNSYFEKGKGLKEYEWLLAHAAEYGFCQPYTKKGAERPDGYNEEKWHWSYLPIATKLTNQYQLRIKDADIAGFEGAEVAKDIEVIRKYVLGINGECLK